MVALRARIVFALSKHEVNQKFFPGSNLKRELQAKQSCLQDPIVWTDRLEPPLNWWADSHNCLEVVSVGDNLLLEMPNLHGLQLKDITDLKWT